MDWSEKKKGVVDHSEAVSLSNWRINRDGKTSKEVSLEGRSRARIGIC